MNSQAAVRRSFNAQTTVKGYAALSRGVPLTPFEIAVDYCGVCHSDLSMIDDARGYSAFPLVPGHEIVGRIEAFGLGAPRHDAEGVPLSVGSRVSRAVAVGCGSCFFCADDIPQKCERPYKYGHQNASLEWPLGGGLSDFIVLVPRTFWLRVPDEVSDHVAAPANCATATVAGLLRHGGPVTGCNVLVLGAGVLGVTACAMALASGASAVVVPARPSAASLSVPSPPRTTTTSTPSSAAPRAMRVAWPRRDVSSTSSLWSAPSTRWTSTRRRAVTAVAVSLTMLPKTS